MIKYAIFFLLVSTYCIGQDIHPIIGSPDYWQYVADGIETEGLTKDLEDAGITLTQAEDIVSAMSNDVSNDLVTDLKTPESLATIRQRYSLEELVSHAQDNDISLSNERNVNIVVRDLIAYYQE